MSQILAKVYTDVITVYSGKSFPGVVCKYYLGGKSDRICEMERKRKGQVREGHVKIGLCCIYMSMLLCSLLLYEIKADGSLVHGFSSNTVISMLPKARCQNSCKKRRSATR